MGRIPELLIRQKLGTLMDTMLDHGVTDPQVMFSAIGDHFTGTFIIGEPGFDNASHPVKF